MPFVVRLAGTADTLNIEIERAKYIAIQTVKRILPIILCRVGMNKEALDCGAADDIAKAGNTAYLARFIAYSTYNAYSPAPGTSPLLAYNDHAAYRAAGYAARSAAEAVDSAKYAVVNDCDFAASAAIRAAAIAAHAATSAAAILGDLFTDDYAHARKIFIVATEILDEAIKLGKQADPIEIATVKSRMERARSEAIVG
jgi:hypothetical protein